MVKQDRLYQLKVYLISNDRTTPKFMCDVSFGMFCDVSGLDRREGVIECRICRDEKTV